MARVFGAELLGPAGFRKQVAVKVIKSEMLEAARTEEVEAFIQAARKDPGSVDADAFQGAKEALDKASVPVHEASITRSLRQDTEEKPSSE